MKSHMFIAGSGRCGTKFMMEVFNLLGLDTGGETEHYVGSYVGDWPWERLEEMPWIVKQPRLTMKIPHWLNNGMPKEVCEHVFLPIRDPVQASRSLIRTGKFMMEHPGCEVFGSFLGDFLPKAGLSEEQTHAALEYLGKRSAFERYGFAYIMAGTGVLITYLTTNEIPFTILQHPRLVLDADYFWEKFQPILKGVDRGQFDEAFHKISDERKIKTHEPVA